MKKMLTAAFTLFMLTGCDPLAPYVGDYSGSRTMTVQMAGDSYTDSANLSFSIDEVTGSPGEFVIGGDCNIKAKAQVSKFTFSNMPKVCPSTNDSGCTNTLTVTAGNGTFSGSALNMNYTGTLTVSCDDGTSAAGSVTVAFNGSKS